MLSFNIAVPGLGRCRVASPVKQARLDDRLRRWLHSRAGLRVGEGRLTYCGLQPVSTFEVKWTISDHLTALEIVSSNKPTLSQEVLRSLMRLLPSIK